MIEFMTISYQSAWYNFLASLSAWISKTAPSRIEASDPELTEVTRLAETSPHLLVDIGFLEVPAHIAGGPSEFVRGPIRVRLSQNGTATHVSEGSLL